MVTSSSDVRSIRRGLTIVTPKLLASPVKSAAAIGEKLQQRLKVEHMIWNLSDIRSSKILGSTTCALDAHWETAAPGLQTPTREHILRLMYSIYSWQNLNATNVTILACENGKTRASLVVATYLKYTNNVSTCTDGLISFYSSCRPPVILTHKEISQKAILHGFLRDMDTFMSARHSPDCLSSFTLTGVHLEGVSVEDMLELEVWCCGRRVFSSTAVHQTRQCLWNYDACRSFYKVSHMRE